MDRGIPPPDMPIVDILLELRAACREKRLARYEMHADTPIYAFDQMVHATFLVREMYAEVFPIRNPMVAAVHVLEANTCIQWYNAIRHQDWPEARRWMRVGIPLMHDIEPGRTYTQMVADHPDELRATARGAYADVLRGVFACLTPSLRTRSWNKASDRIQKLAFTLEEVDLTDTGGPHDGSRTPVQEWALRVQPFLDREPAPRPYGHHVLSDFGLRLQAASPLHPSLFRTALLVTHPKCAKRSRLAALPLPVIQAILRWARLPMEKW